MPHRVFPFAPRSAADLEVGDLLSIPLGDDTWGVLQVSALRRSGPGARTTFGVGVLPWSGSRSPTESDIEGLEFVEHGLTTIEVFTNGGAQVVANAPLARGIQSALNDLRVGAKHSVWGWRTAIQRARSAAVRA